MKMADLRREAENKFSALPLELDDGTVVHLRNLVRLEDTARRNAQILLEAIDQKKDEGSDAGSGFDQLTHQERVIRDLFLLVSDNPDAMKREIEGWDLAVKLVVLEKWMADTQVGEADSSAS